MNPYGTYCTHCGERHADDADWPRTCVNGHTMWNSVPSVAVALVPVRTDTSYGLVGVRRGIQPKKGTITLPGGYLDGPRKIRPGGESWQEAVVRELKEESSGLIDISASEVQEWMTRSSSDGRHCLNFGIVDERDEQWFDNIQEAFRSLKEPNEETLELLLITSVGPNNELGFPTHQEAAEEFFSTMKSRILRYKVGLAREGVV